jgi:hypothetical protein
MLPSPASPAASRRAFPLLSSLLYRESYGALIVLLLAVLLLGPYFRERGAHGGAIIILLIVSGMVTTTTAGNTVRLRRLIRLGFLPLLAVDVFVMVAEPSAWHRVASILGHLVLSGVALVAILRRLLHRQHATADAVLGGITVYLLIGYVFYFVYDLLESAHPGSFLLLGHTIDAPDRGHHLLHFPQLLYFSFVTLTTVGYGDIAPTWSLARSLGVLEALTGQLYLGTLLAILVSSYISGRHAMGMAHADSIPESRPPLAGGSPSLK